MEGTQEHFDFAGGETGEQSLSKDYVTSEAILLKEINNLSPCLEKIINSIPNAEKESTPQSEYFLTKKIPSFTSICLNRSGFRGNLSQKASEDILKFLYEVISLSVRNFDNPKYSSIYLELVHRIFMSKNNFYDHTYFLDESDEAHEFAQAKDRLMYVSKYLIRVINYFGTCGGFSKILDIIRSSNYTIPFIHGSLKIFVEVIHHFTFSFANMYFPLLRDTIVPILLSLSDEQIKNDDIAVVQEIAQNLEKINRNYGYDRKSKEQFEMFNLQMALKYFKSPVLKMRLAGLNDIKSLIQKLEYRGNDVLVSSGYLVAWLRDNKILELLYKENIHPELIRRCAEIPIFLARENQITFADIDLIWGAGVDKHEVTTHAIYTLLNSLVPYLKKVEHINHIYKLVKSIPISSYDSNIFQLLKSITFHGFHSINSDNNEYGLEIMWEIVQDDSISSETKNLAFNFIKENIPWRFCSQVRAPFIQKIIENIQNHKNSCASMKVLLSVLNSYLTEQQSLKGVISKLDQTHNIIKLFFDDLKFYKDLVAKAIAEKPQLKDQDLNNHCFANLPHLQEINERLQFLQTILHKSNITLSQADVDIFWSCIITRSLTEEEKEAGLKWIDSRENNYGNSIYSDDVFLYIYEKKLVELDPETLSIEGINLIYSFFKSINFKNSKLQRDYKSDAEFIVCALDLTGLSLLWDIAFTAKKSDVGDKAISIIINIQKSISPHLAVQMEKNRKGFIQFCMDQLSETLKISPLDEKAELRIMRCLAIITCYIEEFDSKDLSIKRHGSIRKGKPITLKVVTNMKQKGKKSTTQSNVLSLEVYQNDTVKSLREKIAAQMEVPYVALFSAGKELAIDSRTLYSYRISNDQVINAHSKNPKNNKDMAHVSPDLSPSVILSVPHYFDKIFALLSLSDTISDKAWDLLMLLPTNEPILNVLLSCDSPWHTVFSDASLHRMLYSLQIIESIVDTQGATPEEVVKKNAWGIKFHKQGGLNYLKEFLTSDLYKSSRAKSKICVALIFQIIVHFIHRLGEDFAPDAPAIVERIVEIIYNSCISNPGIEDANIVENSLEIFIFLCYKAEIFQKFLEFPNLSDWLYQTLIMCNNAKIRSVIQSCFNHLCTAVPTVNGKSPLIIFYDLLDSFLPKINKELDNYKQYFELFNYVVRSINDSELKESYNAKFEDLLARLVKLLCEHPPLENENREDSILIGLLNLIRTLLCGNPAFKERFGDIIISELYSKCLFKFPSSNDEADQTSIKCKSKNSRVSGFKLLQEVCTSNTGNFFELAGKLLPHHSSFAPSVWQYSPSQLEKSHAGFVGLRNLGATCYMNSVMQQFFMHPNFRRGLLSLPLPSESELNDNQNVLYQMQKLFAHLQDSQKKFYNTIGFCKSYKDYSGQPVNPMNQMDADEFFNMLFEKLENAIKGSKYETFFKDFFGGKVCNQVISKECDHVSENFEDYYTVSVAVKGKSSLEEALDLFVEGDMLEGDNKYQCGKCNQKVDALRRCCLADLPNNIIIHMRRFEFDIEEMRRMKVNDHCQFPMVLNLEPYTKEGLARKEAEKQNKPIPEPARPPSYYQYTLAGVLVHTGTAESGHYYSFIKDRVKSQWFHFNDKDVDYFDEKEIPEKCYGGTDPMLSEFDDPTLQRQFMHHNNRQRIDNAYMLFYQRIEPISTPSDNLNEKPESMVPVWDSIMKENVLFLIDKFVFDPDYFSFILKFLKTNQFEKELSASAPLNIHSPSFRAIELGTRFMFQTLAHAKDIQLLGPLIEILSELYSNNVPACKWFLSTTIQDNWIKHFLILCPVPEIRSAFATLSSRVLSTLSAAERQIYTEEVKEEERDLSYYIKIESRGEIEDNDNLAVPSIEEELFKPICKPFSPKSHSLWFLECLIHDIKYLRNQWRSLEQYFTIFREFCKLGAEEKAYLYSKSIISRFIDFYLGDDSFLVEKHNDLHKRSRLGDKFKAASIAPMVDVIADLIFASDSLKLLSETDRKFINVDVFYHRVLSDNINVERVGDIIAHLAENNKATSTSFLSIISTGLHTEENGFVPYLTALSKILKLEDDFQQWRIDNSMEFLFRVLDHCTSLSFYQIVRFLATESSSNVRIKLWMYSVIEKYIGKWLITHNFDNVRSATEDLVQAIVLDAPKVVNEERKLRMFDILLGLLSICPHNTQAQQQYMQYPLHSSNDDYHFTCSPYKLVEYFRLLRWFIDSPLYVETFVDKLDSFMSIFDRVDQHHYEMDENKAQIIRLIDQITSIDTAFCKHFMDRASFKKRIFDYYISLGNSEPNISYNNNTLKILFSVIRKCCEYDPSLLQIFIAHKNFHWSFEFITLASDFNLAGDELFKISKMGFNDRNLRQKVLSIIITAEKKRIRVFNYKATLDIFEELTQNLEDIIYFCQHGGLDFLCGIDCLRADFEVDNNNRNLAIAQLNLLAKTTSWMTPECTQNDRNHKQSAIEISNSWDSKMDLFLQLQHFLNNCTIDEILHPSYKILYNLSSTDESFLDMILNHLNTEHENFYQSLRNQHDLSYISGPKRPCIKAHLFQYASRDKIHQHEDYYLFIRRLCEFGLNKFYSDASKMKLVVRLLLYAFIEIIPSPGIHTTFIELLETPHISGAMDESRLLDSYVMKVLTEESQILENQECFNFIRSVFPRFIQHCNEEEKGEVTAAFRALVTAKSSGLSENVNTPTFINEIISILKMSSLLSMEWKEIVLSAEFMELFCSLQQIIPTLSERESFQDLKSAFNEVELLLSS